MGYEKLEHYTAMRKKKQLLMDASTGMTLMEIMIKKSDLKTCILYDLFNVKVKDRQL